MKAIKVAIVVSVIVVILAAVFLYISFISEPPIVINAMANPHIIPDDTDGVPLWGETSTLYITVTDNSDISSVTINLSSIGGLKNQPMRNIESNIWSVTTNASAGIARWNGTMNDYVPHQLLVNATDEHGNSNTSVSIKLTVLKNGDVNWNGEVNLCDAVYLANYVRNVPGYAVLECISDVTGDGTVDFQNDFLYLARHVLGVPGYEILH